jgi:aminopeptidase N
MLRDLLGEKSFQKGIRAYYDKYYNSNTTTDEFRIEMEKASGKDLKVFFKQWLYQPINPAINAVWKYDAAVKKITIQLTQSQSGDFLFNTPVEVGYYKTGSTTPTILKMNLSRKQELFSFSVPSAPERVELDPRNILLNNGNLTTE